MTEVEAAKVSGTAAYENFFKVMNGKSFKTDRTAIASLGGSTYDAYFFSKNPAVPLEKVRLVSTTDQNFTLNNITASDLRKVVLVRVFQTGETAPKFDSYACSTVQDRQLYFDHAGNVYENYPSKQSFGMTLGVRNIVLDTVRPVGGLYRASEQTWYEYNYSTGAVTNHSGLPLNEYASWREQVFYLTTTLEIDAEFDTTGALPTGGYELFGDKAKGLGGMIDQVIGILRMREGIDKTIKLKIELKIVAEDVYLSEALFTLSISGKSDATIYYKGEGEGADSYLYINLEGYNLGSLKVPMDIVTPILDMVDLSGDDHYTSLGKAKLACGCTNPECIRENSCIEWRDGHERVRCEGTGCTCSHCVLKCGCTDKNCLLNGSCYDANGVRLCDGATCKCKCGELECGCTNTLCLQRSRADANGETHEGCLDDEGNVLCGICTSKACQRAGHCTFEGDCDYKDPLKHYVDEYGVKHRIECTCSHCMLKCGCRNKACIENGSCYDDSGVLICEKDCTCKCIKEEEEKATAPGPYAKYLAYADNLINAVQIGNKMSLIVLNPNVFNNLLLMMGYKTYLCQDNYAYIKAELKATLASGKGMSDTYIQIGSTNYGVDLPYGEELYDMSIKLTGFKAQSVVKPLTSSSAYTLFNNTYKFTSKVPGYAAYPTADTMELHFGTTIDLTISGGDETLTIDLTGMLGETLGLTEADIANLIIDNGDGQTGLKLRVHTEMFLDMNDSSRTELLLEISTVTPAGAANLAIGVYYVNSEETAYVTLPFLGLSGLVVKGLDLSGILANALDIKVWSDVRNGAAAESVAAAGEDDEELENKLWELLGMELDDDEKIPYILNKYLDSINDYGKNRYEEYQNKAKFVLALGNSMMGVGLNFSLLMTLMDLLEAELPRQIVKTLETYKGGFRAELYYNGADAVSLTGWSLNLNGYFSKKEDRDEFGTSVGNVAWMGLTLRIRDVELETGGQGTLTIYNSPVRYLILYNMTTR